MPEFDLPRADILDVIGKGLTEADLIDADQLGPNARLRRIEREPLLETTWHVLAEAAAEIPDQVAWNFFEQDAAMTYQEALAAVNWFTRCHHAAERSGAPHRLARHITVGCGHGAGECALYGGRAGLCPE